MQSDSAIIADTVARSVATPSLPLILVDTAHVDLGSVKGRLRREFPAMDSSIKDRPESASSVPYGHTAGKPIVERACLLVSAAAVQRAHDPRRQYDCQPDTPRCRGFPPSCMDNQFFASLF